MMLKTIGDNIRIKLAEQNSTLTELSNKSGVTVGELSLLTNNKKKDIKYSTLNKIAMALDCKAWELLKGDE